MNEPQLQRRAAQPYLAISERVRTEAEFRRAADGGFPELFRWLGEHGVAPSGLGDPRWQTEIAYLTGESSQS